MTAMRKPFFTKRYFLILKIVMQEISSALEPTFPLFCLDLSLHFPYFVQISIDLYLYPYASLYKLINSLKYRPEIHGFSSWFLMNFEEKPYDSHQISVFLSFSSYTIEIVPWVRGRSTSMPGLSSFTLYIHFR